MASISKAVLTPFILAGIAFALVLIGLLSSPRFQHISDFDASAMTTEIFLAIFVPAGITRFIAQKSSRKWGILRAGSTYLVLLILFVFILIRGHTG
jgi:fucose permease